MAIKITPEHESPPTQTKPERRRSGDWFTHIRRQVKLALAGDDEDLLVVNTTAISWYVYHTFHRLGVLDPGESVLFHLRKSGNLNARPDLESDAVGYLVLDLTAKVQRVEIYRRNMGRDLDIYDMRVALDTQ
jgi:hypothetical protein